MDKQLLWGIVGIVVSIAALVAAAFALQTPESSGGDKFEVVASSTVKAQEAKSLDNQKTQDTSYALPQRNEKFKTVEADGEMVSVDDQDAGSIVQAHGVEVSRPSWIAVKDVSGRVLGAAWVPSSRETVAIPLLRNTEAGNSYQVVIFVDNGNKQFEIYTDSLVSFDGAPVGLTFSAR